MSFKIGFTAENENNEKYMIYRIIAEGTIEEKIQNLQKQKNELSSKILDGHANPTTLTSEIMRQLILD